MADRSFPRLAVLRRRPSRAGARARALGRERAAAAARRRRARPRRGLRLRRPAGAASWAAPACCASACRRPMAACASSSTCAACAWRARRSAAPRAWPTSRSPCRAWAARRSRCSAATSRSRRCCPAWPRAARSRRSRCPSPMPARTSAAIATTATRDGGGWRLDGAKTWISNAGLADCYVVFARSGEGPGTKGLSAFIVDADTPGLDASERIDVIAPHPLGTLRFDDCRVGGRAAARRSPARASRSRWARSTSSAPRSARRRWASRAARSTRPLRARTSRRMFGRALADFQLTQAKLGDMAIAIDASALLVYRAAWTKDVRGARVTREASMAKLFATESAQQVIDAAVQLFGGLGVVRGMTGGAALPRDPRAAHLRRRQRGAQADHRRPGARAGPQRSRLPTAHRHEISPATHGASARRRPAGVEQGADRRRSGHLGGQREQRQVACDARLRGCPWGQRARRRQLLRQVVQ